MTQGLIYSIFCTVGEKKGYVGQHGTANAEKRWKGHRNDARLGSMLPIHCAIRKYGIENFEFKVIWRGDTALLNEKETFHIADLHTFVDDPLGGGYNLTTGGGQFKMSESSCSKLAKSLVSYHSDRTQEARNEASRLARLGAKAWREAMTPEEWAAMLLSRRLAKSLEDRRAETRARIEVLQAKYASMTHEEMLVRTRERIAARELRTCEG